jgi:Cdc6-like AAA superfamily ATPase
MIAARRIGGPTYTEMIEEMERELNKVIEDFDRAVNVEALHHLANETSKLSCLNLSIVDPQSSGVERAERERAERERVEQERLEQELLFRRLEPVKTGYHRDLRCMDGTRQSLLNHIVDWVVDKSGQGNVLWRNACWVHGSPGIGKTSLAHSICASLHEQNHLAGAFFCRRDDPNLSEPRNILPTFIHKLAILFPPFRTIVAKHLREDPNLTPESMNGSLLLDFIRSLPHHPEHTLVFVIDALDECGDHRSRPGLLRVLTNAAAQAPWLKIIVTSRTEVDIQRFFDTLTQSAYLPFDLSTNQDASADLRTFARGQFDTVASVWHLNTPWPEESDFNKVISRANGLFIYVKTLALALERCEDPDESLKAALQDSAATGSESLYELYSSILKAQIVHNKPQFQRMIGVLLTTSPYRALCDETIAELAGVKLNLVKRWMDALSSLLYRDEAANRGIRVRHLSVYEFFLSDHCEYQVNIRDENVQLGIACLKTMVMQLRFNICKLEDSRLANAEVQDLPSRVKQNISDPLQYSCLHWLSHLCLPPDNRDQRMLVVGNLRTFFEGLYPLFWAEVLSITGMVPIGAPSLRRLLSWVRVSNC